MNRDTILIFEDNAIDREILVELFRSDYKILEAENGREGIALLKDNIASIAVEPLLEIVLAGAGLAAVAGAAVLLLVIVPAGRQAQGHDQDQQEGKSFLFHPSYLLIQYFGDDKKRPCPKTEPLLIPRSPSVSAGQPTLKTARKADLHKAEIGVRGGIRKHTHRKAPLCRLAQNEYAVTI